ncbi:MAG: hypothetical protein KGY99_07075 [Phycisphaerae bacterium]|nr:hypothetical protein [Phycisphaerae bacterium]
MKRWCWVWATLGMVCGTVLGVSPQQWQHTTAADFAEGELNAVMATSRGELRLAPRLEVLLPAEDAPPAVAAVAAGPDALYAGAGTCTKVYRVTDGEAALLAEPPGTMIGTLLWTDGGVLAGTCGDQAGVYRIDREGDVTELWRDESVLYVWAIVPRADGGLYAATGPEGKVFAINAAGRGSTVYAAGELADNVLCLVAGDNGLLYAGTDTNGLVVAIDPAKKSGRVVLDADEDEVAALVPAGAGGLYAATSDAAKVDAAPRPDRPYETSPDGDMPPGPPEAPPVAAPSSRSADAGEAPQPRAPSPADPEDRAHTADADEAAADSSPDGDVDDDVSAESPRLGPPTTAPAERSDVPLRPPARVMRGGAPGSQGNAVYYIHADGLVETVFRRPVVILAMIRLDDRLLLGTGDKGQIFAVTPAGDEVAQLADTDAAQVTALAAGSDGQAYFATANRGSLGRIAPEIAEAGTFTSPVLDAEQLARWGTVRVRHAISDGSTLTVATRSGNVAEPDERTWSDWSVPRPVKDEFVAIASPAARFLQYRLSLKAGKGAGPMVRGVELLYQVGNLAPAVASVVVQASSGPDDNGPGSDGGGATAPRVFRVVQIEATDANGDTLEYAVHFRRAGTDRWIKAADELTRAQYVWDSRTVPDGQYEMRVTASDAPANTPAAALSSARISERFEVDNTRPVIGQLAARVADGTVTVRGRVQDASSRLTALHYAVDSASEWMLLAPADGICDDADETFTFELTDLEPGLHRIAVRGADLYGNVTHGTVAVTIDE